MMKRLLVVMCIVRYFLHSSAKCSIPSSEFHLKGDYLLGGLFDIHHASVPLHQNKPETIDCSSTNLLLPNYRSFQLMRFTVEEINNSTKLLPDVTLGYEVFDHCSDTQSFSSLFKLMSINNTIQPWVESSKNMPGAIAVVGPFTSTQSLSAAPLFMADHVTMVSYGSSASIFSEKTKFPSFLRTVHPNKDTMDAIVTILQHFSWEWVAFLNSDDDFGMDGLEQFRMFIKETDICLAYTKSLNENADYTQMFAQIEAQNIKVIIVFAPQTYVEPVIEAAIEQNVTDKVWIADEGWSMNKRLQKMKGIQDIGTVLGLAQPTVTIPGFSDFIRAAKSQNHCVQIEQESFCNQVCKCSNLSAEHILAADPSFSLPVYSAVYAIAQALHNILKCGAGGCCKNTTVQPYMVTEELWKSNFTLLNQSVQFNQNGDPKFGPLSIVFWNKDGDAQEIGSYHFHPTVSFHINNAEIHWHTDKQVPSASCSPECPTGHAKKQTGIHKCCFMCEICSAGTHLNDSEDPFRCIRCKETEWSSEGSTSCTLRLVEFIPFTDGGALAIMGGAGVLMSLTLAVSVLFAINYNTPVVRSAGGPMCFLILGCLSLSSLSVFFYFGKPTDASCVLRYFLFILLFTVCLACFVVRSFQIVCIFKISATFPKLQTWWSKYYGQWLLITLAFVVQAASLAISFSHDPPRPYNETTWYQDQIVLSCSFSLEVNCCSLMVPLLLCCLCFIFSYMGKDLPKNYNEAKAITFSLVLLIVTWIIFATEYLLYRGKYIQSLNALAVLSSLYVFLLWYFLPKCYIIMIKPHRNTPEYFQSIIQSYTKTIGH